MGFVFRKIRQYGEWAAVERGLEMGHLLAEVGSDPLARAENQSAGHRDGEQRPGCETFPMLG